MPNDITSPFGTYGLGGVPKVMLYVAQAMPVNGIGRKLALAARKIALKTYHKPTVDAVIDGLKWRLYVRDNVSERKFLFMPQFFDRLERNLLRNRLKEGDVFVDIGANAGTYSILAAANVGKSGKVIAIEPNPLVMERLHANALLNGLRDRLVFEPVGVSDIAGSFDLVLDATNLGGSSLVDKHGAAQRIVVQCELLMNIMARNNVTRVAGLKIDIEGAEDRAMIPFLETAPDGLLPGFIIIEDSRGQWIGDVMGALVARGYQLTGKSKMNLVMERHG